MRPEDGTLLWSPHYNVGGTGRFPGPGVVHIPTFSRQALPLMRPQCTSVHRVRMKFALTLVI